MMFVLSQAVDIIERAVHGETIDCRSHTVVHHLKVAASAGAILRSRLLLLEPAVQDRVR